MAASSEIRFKIGADTSALSKAFVGAQSVAAAAGARLQKSFGLKDAVKGIFQGIGIGSVSTITDLVVAPFQRGAEQAKAMAALTSDLFGQTLRYIGVVGGATKQLEQQTKQVNELNRDIAMQRQLVADLNANPINFLTDGGRTAITEAETGLNTLIAKQAEIATNVQIAVLEENRRTEALQRSAVSARALAQLQLMDAAEGRKFAERRNALEIEGQNLRKQGALPSVLQANRNAIADIVIAEQLHNKTIKDRLSDLARTSRAQKEAAALELADAGDRAKAQQKLNALRREYDVIVKRKGRGSPEAEENRMQQTGIGNTLALLNKQAREEQSGALSSLGQGLTGGTVGRRSERERIADRGAARLAQANSAIRSGNSPAFVAQLAAQANRDFKSAGGKVAASTSGVAKGDANDLGGQLMKANETLKAIEKNLMPQTLG
jgi:hypothetical protein